nr:flagellar filament capping protein FliD [uncultured Tolumonas sp.]
MSTITSAGAGSGLDLESIISSSVAAKQSQLLTPVSNRKTETQLTLSGLSQLKSTISNFTSALDKLSAKGAFNQRTTNITQDATDPVFSVDTNDDASNGQYNIIVNKLAATSKYETTFDSSTTSLATEDGTLNFSAGDKTFSVDVKKGDTLQQIRKRINNSGSNFGLTANIVNTSDGKAKLVIDSGVSGTGKDLNITASVSSLSALTTASMTKTQSAADAVITVDGNELTSDTNVFDDKVQGLKLTAIRTSDSDTTTTTAADGTTTTSTTLKSNKLDVTTDTSSIKDLVQKFVDAYNTLIEKSTALGKRNTVVGGESQDDGGALAGDSMPRSIQNYVTNMISTPSTKTSTSNISTIFQLGISMDNNGVLSMDSDTFDTALDDNYEQVVSLFGGSDGLAGTLSTGLKDYTKTGGLISIRTDGLNTDLSALTQKQADISTQMTKYEASLRAQYGSLDTLLASMKSSASYLTSMSSSSS